MTNSEQVTVYYDGGCPLCEREINFYRGLDGAAELRWVDVSQVRAEEVAPGLSREQALARFHVQGPEGQMVSGGDAFATLWGALPGFRWLSRAFRTRPSRWVLNRAYDRFLALRPRLQAFVKKRAAN